MGKQYDAERPCEMTMAKFLDKLEDIREMLWLDSRVHLPNGGFEKNINKGEISKLLRFFALNDVADVWGENQSSELEKTVYEKLNAFWDGISLAFNDDLKERWTQTRGTRYYDQDVLKCIEKVQDDRDKRELRECYGFKGFPANDTDTDRSIVSIQALILLWFAALPCTKEAEAEQNIYRKRLKLKLNLLLNPSEFRGLLRKVYGDLVLNDIQKSHCPPFFRGDNAECDHTQINENEIDKDKAQSK